MPHAAINGQRIYFEDSGGDGPAVILAHGFLMDHEMFAPQVAKILSPQPWLTVDDVAAALFQAHAPIHAGLGTISPRPESGAAG